MHRRLRLESLEDRQLLAADLLRVAAWNTLNGPNDALEQVDVATVLQAIGDELILGEASPIGILALQETDLPGSGNDSVGRVEMILDDLYPTTDYDVAVSALNGGGDATAFVYDTSQVTLLEAVDLTDEELPNPLDLTHSVLRGEFRPVGTGGDADFFVYSVHLKSGDSPADQATRGVEASLLRADADALGDGASVLFVGDFNLLGTTEAAWTQLVASGPGQLTDLAGDQTGTWRNNVAFIGLHTQDPRNATDDRFDFQLATGELFDGQGIDFVTGSYTVLGNDGSHTLGQPIDTGTGASPAVLQALIAASDHLPVIADFTVQTGPALVVTQPPTGVNIAEGGAAETVSVSLNLPPAAAVTVTATPDAQLDLGAGAGVPVDLTFLPGHFDTPQDLLVFAADDGVAETTHGGSVTFTTSSTDGGFDQLATPTVSATIADNDTPSVVISEIMYNPNTSEGGFLPEWVEVVNTGAVAVDLSGWRLDDEDSNEWGPTPGGTVLGVGRAAIFYDEDFTTEPEFRSEWDIGAETLVIGVEWSGLANSPSATDELLVLLDDEGTQRDAVNYDDSGDWPADNNAASIYLADLGADNDNGTNWRRSVVGMDGGVNPAGAVFSMSDVGSPGAAPGLATLPGDYNGDGTVNLPDYTVWRDALSSGGPLLNEAASPGVVDVQDFLAWRNTFGNVAPMSMAVSEAPAAAPLVTAAVEAAPITPPPAEPLTLIPDSTPPPADVATDESPLWLALPADPNNQDAVPEPVADAPPAPPELADLELLYTLAKAPESEAESDDTLSPNGGVDETAIDAALAESLGARWESL